MGKSSIFIYFYGPCHDVPSGYVKIAIEHDHRNRGFTH